MASTVVTYAKSVSLRLTPRCVNRCGFCAYPLKRYRAAPSKKRWRQWLRSARPWQPSMVKIDAGEPFTKDREMLQTVRYYGYPDSISYLKDLLQTAADEHFGSHLISLDLGELRRADLQRLRPHLADYVVGIVPFDPTLFGNALLWNSPTMVPPRRLDLIESLGQLRIPTTINMLVGLGECESSRIQTLAALAELHHRRGHLQAVRITPFHPLPGTPLENEPAADPDTVVRTIRQAVEFMNPVPIQVPAFAVEDYIERCVEAGAHDLGDISADPNRDFSCRVTRWGRIEQRLMAKGYRLVERLAVTESTVAHGLCPETIRGTIAHQLDKLEQRHVQSVVVPAAPVEVLETEAVDAG